MPGPGARPDAARSDPPSAARAHAYYCTHATGRVRNSLIGNSRLTSMHYVLQLTLWLYAFFWLNSRQLNSWTLQQPNSLLPQIIFKGRTDHSWMSHVHHYRILTVLYDMHIPFLFILFTVLPALAKYISLWCVPLSSRSCLYPCANCCMVTKQQQQQQQQQQHFCFCSICLHNGSGNIESCVSSWKLEMGQT